MAPGKGRVKIEKVFPVFQEDIAKMCISMSNNSRHFSRWIEHDSRSFNQSAKGRSLPFSGYNCSIHIIDRPTILKQFLERYPLHIARRALTRQCDNFSLIE